MVDCRTEAGNKDKPGTSYNTWKQATEDYWGHIRMT